MSKPIQSMFEKRKSRFTNTRSERGMVCELVTPDPAATSGRTSCRGSGRATTGATGKADLGKTGGTGKAMNSCLAADDKLWVYGARLSTLGHKNQAVAGRNVVDLECGAAGNP